MSDTSRIEWTTATWNPVVGCEAVSPGCDNCYAAREASHRLKNLPEYQGIAENGRFTGVVRCLPTRMDKPFTWRSPRRIFVNSMSDLFHDDVPDGFIAWVFYVASQCPQHTFQILTKRHARMRSFMRRWADRTGDSANDKPSGMPPMPRGPEAIRATYTSGRALLFADMLEQWGQPPEGAAYPLYDWMEGSRFWPEVPLNVWLGVSVENQQWADIRGEALRQTPAAVRFFSAEPLLGAIHTDLTGIDWVIVGGESGPNARPMHPAWARDLRDQCDRAGVPFFFKQFGEWKFDGYGARMGLGVNRTWLNDECRPVELYVPGADPAEPRLTHTVYKRIGKKAAGRELDGRTWDEYPAGAA